MKASLVTLLSCLALSVLVPAPARANPEVERGVQALAAQHRKAWDTRDINLFMDLFGQPEGLLIAGGTTFPDLAAVKERTLQIWSDRTAEWWKNDRVHVVVLDANTALMQIVFSGRYTLKSGVIWEFNSSASFTSLVRRIGEKWKIVAHSNAGSGRQVGKK